MNLDLNSYINELLQMPDPELVARRKVFSSKTKELESQIDAANQCINTAATMAEKNSHRAKEDELRECLRKHKLNYHAFMQEAQALSSLPSLKAPL